MSAEISPSEKGVVKGAGSSAPDGDSTRLIQAKSLSGSEHEHVRSGSSAGGIIGLRAGMDRTTQPARPKGIKLNDFWKMVMDDSVTHTDSGHRLTASR